MSWGRWVLVAAGVLGLVLAGATVMAGDEEPAANEDANVVMREPLQGDAATYVRTSEQADDGFTFRRSWEQTTFRLPDGTQETFPALRTSWHESDSEGSESGDAMAAPFAPTPTDPLDEEESSEATITRERAVRENGYAQLPGEPAVRRSHYAYVVEHEDTKTYRESNSTRLGTQLPCGGSIGAQLVERTPPEAESVLASCIEERLAYGDLDEFEVSIDSQWTSGERFEDVWRADVSITMTRDGETRQLVRTYETSPQASLILSRSSEFEDPDEGEGSASVLEIADWQDGEAPIETDGQVPGDRPSVSLVDWDARGPAEGDLELFGLERARDAIAQQPDGETYFEDAEDAWIQRAAFVVQERRAPNAGPSHSTNGAECQQPGTASHTLPEPGDRLHWNVFWQDEEAGELWGSVRSPRIAQDNPLGERIPIEDAWATRDEPHEGEELQPALRGPSLQGLWNNRQLVDAFQEEGARTIGVEQDVDFYDRDATLEGYVGRVRCEATSAEDHRYWEVRVTFDEGTATGLEQRWSKTVHESPGDEGEVAGGALEG